MCLAASFITTTNGKYPVFAKRTAFFAMSAKLAPDTVPVLYHCGLTQPKLCEGGEILP